MASLPLLFLSPAASLPQQPLRVTTRLVEVNVVAQTKDGEPADGLTQKDFTSYDGGREEKIAFFSVQKSQAREAVPNALPPNLFTNRLERLGYAPTSATVVLFDGLNTGITDQAYARRQILKFLKQVQPQDRASPMCWATTRRTTPGKADSAKSK